MASEGFENLFVGLGPQSLYTSDTPFLLYISIALYLLYLFVLQTRLQFYFSESHFVLFCHCINCSCGSFTLWIVCVGPHLVVNVFAEKVLHLRKLLVAKIDPILARPAKVHFAVYVICHLLTLCCRWTWVMDSICCICISCLLCTVIY